MPKIPDVTRIPKFRMIHVHNPARAGPLASPKVGRSRIPAITHCSDRCVLVPAAELLTFQVVITRGNRRSGAANSRAKGQALSARQAARSHFCKGYRLPRTSPIMELLASGNRWPRLWQFRIAVVIIIPLRGVAIGVRNTLLRTFFEISAPGVLDAEATSG